MKCARGTRNYETGGPGWLTGMGATVSGNPNGMGPGGEEEEGGNWPLHLAAVHLAAVISEGKGGWHRDSSEVSGKQQ